MEPDGTQARGPELLATKPLAQMLESTPGARSRWIIPPRPEGWEGVALSEWELTGAGFSDHHPHVEVNHVLEGELHVEVHGVEVVARAGDTVCTPAGAVGRYWAPKHARMIAVYGRNPHGLPTEHLDYWEIDRAAPPRQSPQASDPDPVRHDDIARGMQ